MSKSAAKILILYAVFLFGFPIASVQAEKGRFRARVLESTGQVELAWRGTIAKPMAKRFRQAVKRYWDDGHRDFVISLNSGGGKLKQARRVSRLIKRIMSRGGEVITRVGAGQVCGSACIPIFLHSNVREVSVASLWKFHEVTKPDRDRKGYKFLRPNRTRQLFKKVFIPAGVSVAWIASIERKVSGVDYWLTGKELRDSRSGIGTRYTSNIRRRKKISGILD